MHKNQEIRKKNVANALGIIMVEGRKPSAKAMEVSDQYVAGKISAVQAKHLYLKSAGLVP